LLAGGIGAVLAWVFSVWTQLQRMAESRSEVRQRESRIQELEQDLQRYKVELEEQRLMLPASAPNSQTEAYAQ
ncbi:MAG: LapA family protein, partial [Microcoleus sp. SIO2G3]|nr:LapA family protein [Microcoleus sp. SIO2G3]